MIKSSTYRTLILSVFAFLLHFYSLHAQPQPDISAIEGHAVTTDGKAAQGISVQIQSLNRGTATDEKGYYILHKLKPGTYELTISATGIEKQQQKVTLKPGETLRFDITINESSQQLNEVVVRSLSTNKFVHTESEQVAKIPLANLENPQVYSVISKALVQDQVLLNNRDVINNAAGVLAYNTPTGTVSAFIRGFDTRNAVRNGMVTQYRAESDPINIERIEVIKGPSGTLYGSSAISFGGLINKVTKTPGEVSHTEVSLTGGSFGLTRLTADINTPLNADKTALFRLNAAYHNEDSFQDIGRYRNWTAAPSFIYHASDRLTFWVDAELASVTRTMQPYPSFASQTTFKSFKDLTIPYTKYIGGEDVDSKTTVANLFTKAIYKLSDQWTSSTNLNSSNGYVNYSNQLYPRWLTDSTMTRNIGLYSARTLAFVQLQQNFNGDFKIGKLRNRMVIGADITQTKTKLDYTYTPYDTINVKHDFAPLYAQKVNALLASRTPGFYSNTQTSYSAYTSDVINITDQLLAMASVRVDHFVNKSSIENNQAVSDAYNQTAVSPKFGLIYQVLPKQISLFGNYMNGFLNQGPADQPNGTLLSLKPKQANQWETGFKVDAFQQRLNLTVSVYTIKVNNATYTDENNFTIQQGTQRSRGFELELNAEVINHFHIIAGYGKNENRFLSGDPSLIGRRAQGAPADLANLWLTYRISQGLFKNFGLGAGGNYSSKSYWDAANTITLPKYTVLNAVINYNQPKWMAAIKVNNLTDQKYWNPDSQPQSLRQWLASVTFKF